MPHPPLPDPEEARVQAQPMVLVGGFLLATLAGFINAAMLSVFETPVSHMSGAVSTLAIDLGANNRAHLPLVLKIIGGFFLGAMFSGAIIGSQSVQFARRYGLVLVLEAVLLALSAVLLRQESLSGVYFAAMACGLQNAMASSYYGMIVRTTHVTGVVTDLGAMLGSWVRQRDVKPWKLAFYLLILVGFFVGACSATHLHGTQTSLAMLIASFFCGLLGIWHVFWKRRMRGHTATIAVGEARRTG